MTNPDYKIYKNKDFSGNKDKIEKIKGYYPLKSGILEDPKSNNFQ